MEYFVALFYQLIYDFKTWFGQNINSVFLLINMAPYGHTFLITQLNISIHKSDCSLIVSYFIYKYAYYTECPAGDMQLIKVSIGATKEFQCFCH